MKQYINTNHLTVIALLVSKPGQEQILKEELIKQTLKIRNEPGFIQFDLHQSNNDATVFMLYESWTDPEALENHFKQDHTEQLVTKFDTLLAEPLKSWHLTRFEPIVI
jgi:quinol monooxygenase YgiN